MGVTLYRVSRQALIQRVTFDLRRKPSKSLKEEHSRGHGQQEQRARRRGPIFSRKNREVSMQQLNERGEG